MRRVPPVWPLVVDRQPIMRNSVADVMSMFVSEAVIAVFPDVLGVTDVPKPSAKPLTPYDHWALFGPVADALVEPLILVKLSA